MNIFTRFMASICILALTFTSASAWSNMIVYPIETVVGITGTGQVKVISKSDTVQFVRIKVMQVIDAGTSKEREITSDMNDSSALIVTPQKLAVTAGGERVVRLISLTSPKKETTWRVYFEGVSEAEFNDGSHNEQPQKNSAEVGVSIVWGALIHVAPAKEIASLSLNTTSRKIINTGTVRIPLQSIGVCDLGGKCNWRKETATIYPGTEIALKSLNISSGKTYRVKYSNWLNGTNEEMNLPTM